MSNYTLEVTSTVHGLSPGCWRPVVDQYLFKENDKYEYPHSNVKYIKCLNFESGQIVMVPSNIFVDIIQEKYEAITVHFDITK